MELKGEGLFFHLPRSKHPRSCQWASCGGVFFVLPPSARSSRGRAALEELIVAWCWVFFRGGCFSWCAVFVRSWSALKGRRLHRSLHCTRGNGLTIAPRRRCRPFPVAVVFRFFVPLSSSLLCFFIVVFWFSCSLFEQSRVILTGYSCSLFFGDLRS